MPQQGYGLPSNLYAGGAVRLDSSPIANEYMNLLAHQNAQQAASSKYYGELGSRLTPTGMIDEDAKDLMNQKNDWQAFNMQNKGILANPRNPHYADAYTESMQRYNKMQDLIERSKNKSTSAQRLIKPVVEDPKKYELLTDDAKDKIHLAGLPVNHPQYRPIQADDIQFKEKPFSTTDQAQLQKVLFEHKGDLVPGEPVRDPKTGTQTVTSTRRFGSDDLNSFRSIGQMMLNSHGGWRQTVEGAMNPTNPDFATHNATFKQHFGRDIQDANDMSTAMVLENHPLPMTVTSQPKAITYSLPEKSAATQSRQINVNQQKINQKQQAAGQGNTEPEPMPAHEYVNGIVNTALSGKPVGLSSDPNGKYYKLPVDADILKHYTRIDGKDKLVPDLMISADGKTIKPLYYKDRVNGVVDAKLSQPFTREEFESTVGSKVYGKKQVLKEASALQQTTGKKQIPGWHSQ